MCAILHTRPPGPCSTLQCHSRGVVRVANPPHIDTVLRQTRRLQTLSLTNIKLDSAKNTYQNQQGPKACSQYLLELDVRVEYHNDTADAKHKVWGRHQEFVDLKSGPKFFLGCDSILIGATRIAFHERALLSKGYTMYNQCSVSCLVDVRGTWCLMAPQHGGMRISIRCQLEYKLTGSMDLFSQGA